MIDYSDILRPEHCAIVNMECQENLLGSDSVLPALAAAARESHLIENLARLFDVARSVQVPIFYCTDERRPDGFGIADNLPIRAKMVGGYDNLGGHGPVMAPISPQPADVVFAREQGVTGFFGTGLDQYLRNIAATTLVITGVSLNLAVLGTTIEAANRGYTVVVPTDGVAGVPSEYVAAALKYTIRNIAYTSTCAAVAEHWTGVSARPARAGAASAG
jgi:biuret amidohydrolase